MTSEQLYFRERAQAEARLVEASERPEVRSVHEQLRDAYLARAGAAEPDGAARR